MKAFDRLNAMNDGPETKVLDVKLGDKVEQITIRRLGFTEAQMVTISMFETQEDGTVKPNKGLMPARNAMLISEAVIEPDGSRSMTPEQAAKLHPSIGNFLVAQINDFNLLNTASPVEDAAKKLLYDRDERNLVSLAVEWGVPPSILRRTLSWHDYVQILAHYALQDKDKTLEKEIEFKETKAQILRERALSRTNPP